MSIESFGSWLARQVTTPGPAGDLASWRAGQCDCRGCTYHGLSVSPTETTAEIRTELDRHFGSGALYGGSPMHTRLDLAVQQWRAEYAGHRVIDHGLSCVECGGQRVEWSGDGPRRAPYGVTGSRVVQVVRCGQCGHAWSVEIVQESRAGTMRLLVHP